MSGELTFRLKDFEGPLDLLLYLITKHKLNIYDIEISLLLEQYLEYIENLSETDFELAGEFLEMAARLIYIKTVSLLPKPEEAQELKKELEGRLIEYSICKLAAQKLAGRYIGGESFVREPMELPVDKTYNVIHSPQTLYDAYMNIYARAKKAQPLKASIFEPIVSHRIVSVTSKIIFILKNLYTTGSCSMDKLYDGIKDKSERVATFLAVLELTKSGRIRLNDNNSMLYFSGARRIINKRNEKQPVAEDADEVKELSEYDNRMAAEQKQGGAMTKVNLWNNPAVIRHYNVAQGALKKANFWGYVKKGKNLCR